MTEKNHTFEDKDFTFKSELFIKTLSLKEVEALFNAIKPETIADISPRGKAEIAIINGNILQMTFLAVDFVSLRAIIGSYLRWLDGAISSLNIMEKESSQ